ncbi:MAG: hypothetical protein KAT27_04495 [Desulfobacterales bacterium]|nr:hypothetical protein [Desulfobacterales bacterium]
MTQRKYYRPSDNTVRHNAFMPNREGKTSVYRIGDLTNEEIYGIGREYVAEPLGKPLLGRADIVSSHIMDIELRIESHPDPHPRHANIVNWPPDKSKQKMIAVEIANEAQLHLIDQTGSGN